MTLTQIKSAGLSKPINLADDEKIQMGGSNDFEIFHQSSNGNSIIRETGGGNLSLQTNGANLNFYDSANNKTLASFVTNGAANLYHSGTKKFETKTYGAEFSGDAGIARTAGGYTFREVAGGSERAGIHSDASNDLIFKAGGASEAARFDASTLRFGIGTTNPAAPLHVVSDANNMMQLVSTDRYSTMYLVDSAGSTFIQCDSGVLRFGGGGGAGAAGGESEFMRIGSTGLVGIGTNSPQSNLHIESATPHLRLSDSDNSSAYCLFDANGANLNIHADKGNTVANSTIGFGVDNAIQFKVDTVGGLFNDNKKLRFGTQADLQIYHSGVHGSLNNYTGNLYIQNNVATDNGGDIHIRAKVGKNSISCLDDDAVVIYHNNAEKVRTTAQGIAFNGDTAAANSLDDYEEGTFTPTSNNGLGTAQGSYTKIGRQVTLHIRVTVDSNINNNAMVIGGFPFNASMPSGLSNGAVPAGFGYISGSVITGGIQIHMRYDSNQTNFYTFSTNLQRSHFSGRELRFGLVYHTA